MYIQVFDLGFYQCLALKYPDYFKLLLFLTNFTVHKIINKVC